ncbi:MAG: hypothetical protein LQ342_007504 [Letrouitia transgressa]|nr:MAG: hypothetical protein LQ342_007504 [Letrouitia transgressa]
MSFTPTNPDPHSKADDEPATTPAMPPSEPPASKQPFKSYRKKYLKMRHTFKVKMRESNALFDAEQQSIRTARRLQEENDQFLELLLTVNSSNILPTPLRYTLSPSPPNTPPSLSPDSPPKDQPLPPSPRTAHRALREARIELRRGEISPTAFEDLESKLQPVLNEPSSLSQIIKETPHTTLESVSPAALPLHLDETYLDPTAEEDYLQKLDADLVTGNWRTQPFASNLRSEKDHSRDLSLNNPSSVYNWLRVNRPETFADSADPPGANHEGKQHHQQQHKGSVGSKASPNAHTGGSRRESKRERAASSVTATVKQELEMLDEDGNVIGGMSDMPGVGTRGKRKREGDEAYRPKGGSSRPGKRKKAGVGGRKSGNGIILEED